MSSVESSESSGEIDYSLRVSTELACEDIHKVEIILLRTLSLVKRLSGGNEDIAKFIMVLQKTVMWLKQVQMMIYAIQMAAGPIGWAYAAVSIVGVAVITQDALADSIRVAN